MTLHNPLHQLVVHLRTRIGRATDHAYSALISPLAELVGRIGWGVIVVIGLILTYRITDNIWGSFAFPFYLQELKYTGDEVAFASKILCQAASSAK